MKKNNNIILLLLIHFSLHAQKPRARDVGIPFDGTTGKFNAITDVKGVEVGYSTIISGQGKIFVAKARFVLVLQPFYQGEELIILCMQTGIR